MVWLAKETGEKLVFELFSDYPFEISLPPSDLCLLPCSVSLHVSGYLKFKYYEKSLVLCLFCSYLYP